MVAFLAEWEVDQYTYRDMHIARDSLKNAITDLEHDVEMQEYAKHQK